MPQARLFVPQDPVESWLTEGRADMTQDTLTLDGHVFYLSGAVRFLAEVSGATDTARLVGRIKSREQLDTLQAEHTGDSVVLADNAYEVAEGYLLSLASDVGPDAVALLQKLFAQP